MSIEQEFERRKALMKSRYKDFYIHKEKSRRFVGAMETGKEELKKKRQAWQEQYELARKRRVENRKPPVDFEKQEAKWQIQKQKEVELYSQRRTDYVKRRNQLRALEEELVKIPEEEEFGLIYENMNHRESQESP